jgi:hypothetical protein
LKIPQDLAMTALLTIQHGVLFAKSGAGQLSADGYQREDAKDDGKMGKTAHSPMPIPTYTMPH